jgi:hypothetical protein
MIDGELLDFEVYIVFYLWVRRFVAREVPKTH